MANQFIHINAYGFNVAARRQKECRTITGVFGELMRTATYSKHVKQPGAPTVLWGEDPAVVLKQTRQAFDSFLDHRRRHLRRDALAAIVGVASWPVAMADIIGNPAEERKLKAWERDNIKWLKDRFGDALKLVVRHDDELFPHHHFAVIPEDFTTLLDLHAGHAARREAVEAGLRAPEPNDAYKAAMVRFQDDYYHGVAEQHECARISEAPRVRYSRKAYAEKLRTGYWEPGVGPVMQAGSAESGHSLRL